MSEQSRRGPVPDPVPDPPKCRLVSYNVLYEGLGPDSRGWADRSEALVAELHRLRPAVIAFQEVWKSQYTDLRESLSAFSWAAATDRSAHTPIAYRTDQFTLTDSGTFWLAPPDAGPGTPAWDAAFQRLSTYATLDHRDANRSLTVMNVHLDHEGEQARHEGVALARDRLADYIGEGEGVLVGDFNCQPGDPAHERATSDHKGWPSLSDAATVAEQTAGPAETYTGFPEQTYQSDNIDHVLISDGIGVKRLVTCVPPSESDRRPSDHRPVLADLSY